MFETESYENGEIVRWAWARDIDLVPQPFWTSVYLIDGLLIDTGPPAGSNEFERFIESNLDEVEKVVITHWHEDHCGGANYLTEELDLPVFIHGNGIDKVRNGFSLPYYRETVWGGPVEPAPEVRRIDFDSINTRSGRYSFEVMHMPGHSSDLVALIEPEKEWIFEADTVSPERQMSFGETRDGPEEEMEPVVEDIEGIYSSLRKLQQRASDMDNPTVFTSSYGEFGGDIVDRNVDELEELHENVHEYREEGLEVREIVEKLFGGEHLVGELTNHAFSRKNLVESLLEWPRGSREGSTG